MNDYRQITSKKLSKSGDKKIMNSYNKNLTKSKNNELDNSIQFNHDKSKNFSYKIFIINFI
jgi:hypothetical protein